MKVGILVFAVFAGFVVVAVFRSVVTRRRVAARPGTDCPSSGTWGGTLDVGLRRDSQAASPWRFEMDKKAKTPKKPKQPKTDKKK